MSIRLSASLRETLSLNNGKWPLSGFRFAQPDLRCFRIEIGIEIAIEIEMQCLDLDRSTLDTDPDSDFDLDQARVMVVMGYLRSP